MTPQDSLERYIEVAKTVMNNPERMRSFLKMMGTKQGAVMAVHTIIQVMEQKRPVEANIKPMLAMSIYMMLVDRAMKITDNKPNPVVVKDVIATLTKAFTPQATPDKVPAQPGVIAQAQGVPA